MKTKFLALFLTFFAFGAMAQKSDKVLRHVVMFKFKEKEIFDFMYKHGAATFQLKAPGTTFTLIDNSFTQLRVGGPTALAVGVTALSYGLSIGYRLAGHLFDEHSKLEKAARFLNAF